jgi:hypothetical protein
MTPAPIKVIYVAGDNHCGSTLVGRVLGQSDGFFMAGEIRELWNRGVKDRVACSCGQPMPECEVWGRVIARSSPEPLPDPAAMIRLQWEPTRSRHLGLLLARRRRLAAHWRELTAYSARLYKTIVEATGCRVIVDTSKAPLYAMMLGVMPDIDLSVIHLVRDPRGSAYSWYQRRVASAAKKGAVYRGRPSEPAISLRWAVLNGMCAILCARQRNHAMLLRYEDFLKDPGAAVERITRLAGEPAPAQPWVVNGTVDFKPGHIGLGNPSRTDAGRVTLRRDDRWRVGLSGLDKALITAVTLPLFVSYGYFKSD